MIKNRKGAGQQNSSQKYQIQSFLTFDWEGSSDPAFKGTFATPSSIFCFNFLNMLAFGMGI